jgi:CRP-like cAMP-binding protein
MFYVLRGTVKVASSDSEATYQEIKENNFFGDVGVLYRVPRSMDVLAKNRCAIAILSGDDLVKTMEQSPEMATAIGYQTQERYQMYLKRRHSISVRRNMDGGANMPEPIQDESQSENFAKCDVRSAIEKVSSKQSKQCLRPWTRVPWIITLTMLYDTFPHSRCHSFKAVPQKLFICCL